MMYDVCMIHEKKKGNLFTSLGYFFYYQLLIISTLYRNRLLVTRSLVQDRFVNVDRTGTELLKACYGLLVYYYYH